MKLVALSGPRGAGKDTVQDEMVDLFGDRLHRVMVCTTRPPRKNEVEGREYHFISEDQYDEHLRRGSFAFWNVISPTQRSGTLWNEFEREAGIWNVVPEGARYMREALAARGGRAFLIYLYVSAEERLRRVSARQPDLTLEAVQALLKNDPVSVNPADHCDFDLLLENACLDDTFRAVKEAIQHFIA